MICYYLQTENNPVSIKIAVTSSVPVDLIIKGNDVNHMNSIYFQREVKFFSGVNEFDIPMPLTPKRLKVCAYSKDKTSIKINYIKAAALSWETPVYFNSEDKEYYNFIFDFCKKAGYLPAGIYYSLNKKFKIKLSDKIYDENGRISSTPARVFHDDGEIEISKDKFKIMTVFMRVMILLHERFHIRLPRESDPLKEEEKADLAALTVYRAFNFPKTEALASFIKVFRPVNASHERALLERTDKLFNFLKFN